MAEPYATLSGVSAEVLVVRFFGLFFMFYQMAQIWGNLISSASEYSDRRVFIRNWQAISHQMKKMKVMLKRAR